MGHNNYIVDLCTTDVRRRTNYHRKRGHLGCISDDGLQKFITETVEKFKKKAPFVEQGRQYIAAIEKFTDKELARTLWQDFEVIPVDRETECITQDWNIFKAGTFREDIWHWFESTFDINIPTDLEKAGE